MPSGAANLKLTALGAMRRSKEETKPTKTTPESFGTEKVLSHRLRTDRGLGRKLFRKKKHDTRRETGVNRNFRTGFAKRPQKQQGDEGERGKLVGEICLPQITGLDLPSCSVLGIMRIMRGGSLASGQTPDVPNPDVPRTQALQCRSPQSDICDSHLPPTSVKIYVLSMVFPVPDTQSQR